MVAIETPVKARRRVTVEGIVLVAAVATGVVAWLRIAWPVVALSAAPNHLGHFILTYAHMAGGTIMLFFGALNLYIGKTGRFRSRHRLVGYTYIVGGFLAALAALYAALSGIHREPAYSGIRLLEVSSMGYSLAFLSIFWIGATAMALRAALNRRFDQHFEWMIRSYVLAWSFVIDRLLEPIEAVSSIADGDVRSWMAWVGPALVAEYFLQWSKGGPRRTRAL